MKLSASSYDVLTDRHCNDIYRAIQTAIMSNLDALPPGMDAQALGALIRSSQTRARELGVETARGLAAFVLLTMACGEGFERTSPIDQLLATPLVDKDAALLQVLDYIHLIYTSQPASVDR